MDYISNPVLVIMFFTSLSFSPYHPITFSLILPTMSDTHVPPLTTARAPVYLTRKLPSSCLTYLLYCHHQIFICKGEDLWMVTFLVLCTHSKCAFWRISHNCASYLQSATYFCLGEWKKDCGYLLRSTSLHRGGGGGGRFRGVAPYNGLKTTRGQWCNKDLLKPGTSTKDQRNSGMLKAQLRTRWDGIFCEGEQGYSGRNISNKEIWGESKKTGEKEQEMVKEKQCYK